jgi:hypothetical protein
MPFIKHESSSQIHSTHYDPVEQELSVRFKCNCKTDPCPRCGGKGFSSEYKYSRVPAETYAAVRDAESVGKAFAAHIKGKPKEFPFERIS